MRCTPFFFSVVLKRRNRKQQTTSRNHVGGENEKHNGDAMAEEDREKVTDRDGVDESPGPHLHRRFC